MIYSIDETETLLKSMLKDKMDIYDIINTFYRFLNIDVECNSQDFLVEALPYAKYNENTETFSEEKMLLSLTRQYKRDGEDEYWQIHLNLYFTMNPYFQKYEFHSKSITLTLLKIIFNLNKNSIWATNEKKEKQILSLIEDVVEHGTFESYDIDLEYTE